MFYLDTYPLLVDREPKDVSFPGCKPRAILLQVSSKITLTTGPHLTTVFFFFFLFQELRPSVRTETRFRQAKSVQGMPT